MSNISNANPNILIILSAVIALVIPDDTDAADLESIGNFLTAVADLILLKSGQLAHLEDAKDKLSKITDLENQLNELKRQCT